MKLADLNSILMLTFPHQLCMLTIRTMMVTMLTRELSCSERDLWIGEHRKSPDMTDVGKDKKRRRSVRFRRISRNVVIPEQVK